MSPAATPTSRRGLSRRPLVQLLLCAAFLIGAGVVHLRITPARCDSAAVTSFGDGTSGAIQLAWLFDRSVLGPGDGFSEVTSAPGGEPLWQPAWWSQTLVFGPIWALTKITNSVCATNVWILASLVLSGLAMFVLVRWLTSRPVLAGGAAYVFAYSAFTLHKASGHIAYTQVWPFPLLILLVLLVDERRTFRSAVGLSAVMGAAPWIDGYYLPFVWLIVAAAGAILLVRTGRGRRAQLARLVGAAAAGAAVVQAPLVLLIRGGGSSAERINPLGEMDLYGARPQDFVTPPPGSLFRGWWSIRPGVDSVLYLGWVTLALAVLAVVLWLVDRRRAPDKAESPGAGAVVRTSTAAVPFLAILGLGLAYASGPARPHLGRLELPNPVGLAVNAAPYWRVFARLGIAVLAIAICLAAIALARLGELLRYRWSRVAFGCLVLAALVGDRWYDVRTGITGFDYAAAPAGYLDLRDDRSVRLIADYPMPGPSVDINSSWATFQPVHAKRTVNAKVGAPATRALYNSLGALQDPATVPLLRRLGVDRIVVHPEQLPPGAARTVPADLELVARYRGDESVRNLTAAARRQRQALREWYRMDVYRIRDGPSATAYVAPGRGWGPTEVGATSLTWSSRQRAELVVRSFERASQCRVSVDLRSLGPPRRVRITTSGTSLWEGDVASGTTAAFVSPCGGDLTVSSEQRPVPVRSVAPGSTDPRSLTFGVSGLRAEALR